MHRYNWVVITWCLVGVALLTPLVAEWMTDAVEWVMEVAKRWRPKQK